MKNMNSKIITNTTINNQASKNAKHSRTKQTTRTGRESQKWRSHGGLPVGTGREGMEEKVQGIRSMNGR